MGIDYNGLQFLRFAARNGPLGRVATIGRQEIGPTREEVANLLDIGPDYSHEKYCENLLSGYLGASCVESFDYSDYEGANHIADMNMPFGQAPPTYDTVIDAGSLEHIYNTSQALHNVSQLCSVGGQILHMVPSSNYCGHGFWQFSPELFFSLYSPCNGYRDTRVFLVPAYRTDKWYEVKKPESGRRVLVVTFSPTFVYCRTVKVRASCGDKVQQSDYVQLWSDGAAGAQINARPAWRAKIASALQRSTLFDFAYIFYIKTSGRLALSSRNPNLTARVAYSLGE